MVTRCLKELANKIVESASIEVNVQGDAECPIVGVAPVRTAQPGDITFVHNPRYAKYLRETKASAIILTAKYAENYSGNALIVSDPYYAYACIAALFDKAPVSSAGQHHTAVVGADCSIASSVSIGAQCVIGERVRLDENVVIGAGCVIGDDCHIGAETQLQAQVTLYHKVTVGKRSTIHSGVILGASGFGLAKFSGSWFKVPQLGGVVVGDDVDIGANTTIDRGTLEDTVIGDGVKLDNLIQIGHNVVLGEHAAIAGCVGIAGSTVIGKHCMIGGGACIAGHLEITDNVVITGMGAVSRSLKKPGIYSSGTSVQPNHEWRKNSARFHRLDVTVRRLRNLEKAFLNHRQFVEPAQVEVGEHD